MVDDIIFAGVSDIVDEILNKLEEKSDLGTVFRGPGSFLVYGIQMEKDNHCSIHVKVDDRLEAVESLMIDRTRWKQVDYIFNVI